MPRNLLPILCASLLLVAYVPAVTATPSVEDVLVPHAHGAVGVVDDPYHTNFHVAVDIARVPDAEGAYLLETVLTAQEETPETSLFIILPEGIEPVGGEEGWTGTALPGQPVVLKTRIRPTADGDYFVASKAFTVARETDNQAGASLDLVFHEGRVSVVGVDPEPPLRLEVALEVPDLEDLTAAGAAGTITVKGRVTYRDASEVLRPAWGINVQVWDVDTFFDSQKGSGATNTNGDFSIVADNCDSCDGGGTGPIEVRVVFLAGNTNIVNVMDNGGTTHQSTTGQLGSFADGSIVTVTDPQLTNDAYIILRKYMDTHSKMVNSASYTPGQVDVTWPRSGDSTSAPHYHPETNDIHLPQTHAGGDTAKISYTLDHEYGHYLHNHARGGWGMDNACVTDYDKVNSLGCGYVEGWANFFAGWVQNSPSYTYPNGGSVNFETTTPIGTGAGTPYRVSAAMWDLFDSTTDGEDQFSNSFTSSIFATLKSWSAVTYDSYKDVWNGASRGTKQIVSASYRNTIDYDNTAPSGSLVSPVKDCTYLNDVQVSCSAGSGTKLTGTGHTVKGRGSDGVGVWKTEILKDGVIVATLTNPSNNEIANWAWTFTANDHLDTVTLRVRVTDYGGEVFTTSSLSVQVLDE